MTQAAVWLFQPRSSGTVAVYAWGFGECELLRTYRGSA